MSKNLTCQGTVWTLLGSLFFPKRIGKNFEILTAKLEVTNVIFSDYPQRKPNILSTQKWTKVNQKLMVQPISLMTPELGIASRSASGYKLAQ